MRVETKSQSSSPTKIVPKSPKSPVAPPRLVSEDSGTDLLRTIDADLFVLDKTEETDEAALDASADRLLYDEKAEIRKMKRISCIACAVFCCAVLVIFVLLASLQIAPFG
jgi:hypothetical protein